MKFLIKFAIIGLLVNLLINEIHGQLQLAGYLSKMNKNLKTNSEEVEAGFETDVHQLSRDPTNWMNYARIGTGLASVILPQPAGLIVGLASTAFFSFYDADLDRQGEKLQQYENENRRQEAQSLNYELTEKLDAIGKAISIESDKIIKTIENEITGIHQHIDNVAEKIIETLKNIMYGSTSFNDLCYVLNYLNIFYRDNIDCLLKKDCLPQVRRELIDNLELRGKEFRTRLSTFVTQFIYTSATLPTSIDRVPGFFTYILDEYKLRAKERRDCNIESEHSEIYRLYTIIIMTLQKSYSMVIAAHMMGYRENIKNKTLSRHYLKTAVSTLERSNKDAEIVTRMAYLALEKASREIRRCDPDKHKEGKTYDRFVYINGLYTGYTYNRYYIASNNSYVYIDNSIKRVEYLGLNPTSYDGIYGRTNQGYVRLNTQCEIYHDVAEITHYYDIMDETRLYHHFDFTYKNGTQKTFGKLAKENQLIAFVPFEYPFKIFGGYCQSSFCPSPVETCPIETPDNAIHHISLVAVNATTGYVVTGIRWRIKNKILYFEIQEGKYVKGKLLNETIYWKETPTHEISNDKTVAIGKKTVKGFMMNDAHLPTDYLLSAVTAIVTMKFLINFTIIGLLIILMINQINGESTNYLSQLSEKLKTNGGDLKRDFTRNLDKLSEHPNDWQNYARLAIDIGSFLLPPPIGLAVSMTSSAFFYFYDAQMEKELHHYENEKQQRDINLFINDMTSKINQISQNIWIESHNIIQTIEKEIIGHQNNINNMTDKFIEILKNVVYKQTSFYDLHSVLNYLNIFYRDNIDCLLKNDCLAEDRQDLFDNLLIRSKTFRTTLSTLVTQFIYTSETLPTSIDRVPGFFTYILDEYKLRAKERRDCNIESEHSEIYRLYTIIILTLQKSYSMIVSAHMMRYCENIKNKTLSEPYLTSAINALKKSSDDIEIITKMAYLALEKASREIRRCDPIQHEKGKTYDRFVYINGSYTGFTYNRYYIASNNSYVYIDNSIKKVEYLGLNSTSYDGIYGRTNQGYVRLNTQCEIHKDVAEITHYYDTMDEQRLYHHFDFTYNNGTKKTFGKLAKKNQSIVFVTFQYPFKIFGKFCQSPYCPSPVKTCSIKTPHNAIHHISLVAVNASSGYVVTGIRWRIKNKILYFEIQEGKYVEGKPLIETIYWKETPTHEISNDKTVAIGKKTVKGFMMNDAHLPTDYLLSAITGLLFVLLINNINCQLKINKFAGLFAQRFNETSKDLQKPFDLSIKPAIVNTTSWENYGKMATGIAALMIPQPMGLTIGLTSSAFFSLYDAHWEIENERLNKLKIQEKADEEILFRAQLTTKLNDISYQIADKTNKTIEAVEKQVSKLSSYIDNVATEIVATLKNAIHSNSLFDSLFTTIINLETYYKNNIDCLLKSDCTPEDRAGVFYDLLTRTSYFRTELSTFVTKYIDPSNILQTSAARQYGLYYYLLYEYKDRAKKHLDCDVETEQSEIYRSYVYLTLLLEKSYSMVVAAHMIKYRENIDNKTLAEQYLKSAKKILQISVVDAFRISDATKIAMEQSSTEIRRCDPNEHKKGITYDRFVQLYGEYTGYTYDRYYIQENASYVYVDSSLVPNKNRFNLDPNSRDGLYGYVNNRYIRLNENCKVHRNVSDVIHYYDVSDRERLYHHYDLFYRDGSSETFGKPADENQLLISHKFKYPFALYTLGNPRIVCQGKYCPSPVETCSIETNHNFAIRHISLVPVDANDNHVVTGIRWKIKNTVLYFEIQQGEVYNGSLLRDTVHWKKTQLHEITIKDTVAIEEGSVKGFMLEDVHLPSDHYLTGVQFARNSQDGIEDLVRIKLFGKKWNQDRNTFIKTKDPLPTNIIRLALDHADASEQSHTNSAVLSTPGKNYIHFQQTDKKKDAGQSSIPYLDIQEVVSNPPRALQGLGIYYKGSRGYGGFVGIRGFIADMNDDVGTLKVKEYSDAIDDILEDLKDPSVFTA
ncbi:hypothetical protein HCN44_001108 [Aphidius gifuensis]|uniref:Uncharacterized protein n=1 Tax=Aphidius gifuensis TaxID=684658 RepID=A0A835CPW9_APHGI|nr:hypothetical protein HCN44_001108 [Aphidius gifuensis]